MRIELEDDVIRLSRHALRFPLELRRPEGFRPDDPSTWPDVEGSLELVGGRLLYMPPCGDVQQDVVPDLLYVLRAWTLASPDFVVGGNEAGMLLEGEIRGADAAIWRKADLPPRTGGFRRVAPVAAMEVAAEDDTEEDLRQKAAWYLGHGVGVVWLLLPRTRDVVILHRDHEARFGPLDTLPDDPLLPGLCPAVRALYAQLE